MGQIYKITNTKNPKIYIGISFSRGGNYLDRFEKHMAGEGGVWIRRDLEQKLLSPVDFSIEVLEESDDVEYLRTQEIFYIETFDSLYPNGYNGNKGNYIIQTEEIRQKAKENRRRKFEAGEINLKGIHLGKAVYRYPTGEIAMLETNHPDVLTGKVKHINYTGGPERMEAELNAQRERNGGITDKQLLYRQLQSILWQEIYKFDWWQKGRQTFRERMERKEFTEKELASYEKRSEQASKQWGELTYEERLSVVSAGLNAMNNDKLVCEHCGKTVSKGNYARWHGDKCKMKP